MRVLHSSGYQNLITRTHADLNLTEQTEVARFFKNERPEIVIVAAGRVGGILANQDEPAQFIYENAAIATNIIHAAHLAQVSKLLYLGSSCIYPKEAPVPIREQTLLSGPLETSNQWYACAKILGIKLCQAYREQFGCDFVAAMPTNLYGPNDTYSNYRSHVLPGLLQRIHLARANNDPQVTCWGTGNPRREFLYVDDLASACIKILQDDSDHDIINVGSGQDLPIRDLAESVCRVVGYRGKLTWDLSKPDGTFQKLLDSNKIRSLGWKPETPLEEGLEKTYRDFLKTTRGENAFEIITQTEP